MAPVLGLKKIRTRLQVHLAPVFINKTDQGTAEYLEQNVTKYIPELEGVVISFSNIQKLERQCVLKTESPFLHFFVSVDLILFKPEIGMVMVGIVNKVSPDHIGCLVNGYFNCSIAKDQFATNYFEWKDESGHWVGKGKDSRLVIKPGKMVLFSIIKIITSNDMLSLHGSMLQKYEDCGIVDDSKMESPPDATFQQLEPKFDKNIFEYENRFDEETEIEDSVANPRKITFGNLKLIDSDGEQDLESLVEVDTPITATPEKEDPATPENEGPTEEIATPAEKAKGIKKGKNKASKSNSLSNNERAVRDVSPVLDESKNSKKRKPADEQKIQARKPKKLKKSK